MDDRQRYDQATAHLDPPFAVLDLAALRSNASGMVRRAAGKPIRVASKSIRSRPVLERILAMDGFTGTMAFTLPEALWLVSTGAARRARRIPDRGPGRAGRAGLRHRRGTGDHGDGGPDRAPGLHRGRGRRRPQPQPPRDPGMPGHRRRASSPSAAGSGRASAAPPSASPNRPPTWPPTTAKRPGLPAGRASWPTRRRSPESATTRRATPPSHRPSAGCRPSPGES